MSSLSGLKYRLLKIINHRELSLYTAEKMGIERVNRPEW